MSGIKTFRRFPRDLFRINSGPRINLRPRPAVATASPAPFDIITEDDEHGQPVRVLPWAFRASYRGPNGATFRPNTPYAQHLITHAFRAPHPVVYAVDQGTPLPDHLILVHDPRAPDAEAYSLEPAREMTLDDLNSHITDFLRDNAAALTRQQWARAWPRPEIPLADRLSRTNS